MKTEELIKILRKISNDLKDLERISSKSNNNDDVDKQKVLNILLLECGFECIYFELAMASIIKKDYTAATIYIYYAILLYIILIRKNMKKYNIKSLKELNEIEFISKIIGKFNKKEEEIIEPGYTKIQQINNMENAIGFLKSLTEEEKERYLVFKLEE